MEMPGRKWQGTSDKYRYGMNTQEKDDEIFEGAMGARYWEYDSRIGRRWERDPIVKPWESPYATFGNNPIYFADPNGLDPKGKGKGGGDKRTGNQKREDQLNKNAKNKTWKIDENGKPVQDPNVSSAPSGGAGNTPTNNGSTTNEKSNGSAVIDKIANVIDNIANVIDNIIDATINVFLAFDNYAYTQQSKPDLTPPVHTKLSGLEQTGGDVTKGNSISGTGKIERVYGYNPGEVLGGISNTSPFGKILANGKGGYEFSANSKSQDVVEGFTQISGHQQAVDLAGDNINNLKNKPAINGGNAQSVVNETKAVFVGYTAHVIAIRYSYTENGKTFIKAASTYEYDYENTVNGLRAATINFKIISETKR